MKRNLMPGIFIIVLFVAFVGCREHPAVNEALPIDSIAGNEDVRNYLKSFKGRGELSNDSIKPTPSAEALKNFRYPKDLALELVLSEPAIVQPVEISFDHRGRLWVVQYNQYPYPKGLKITNVDNYLRVTFDRTPAPPPNSVKGADKITFFEDSDGDGVFDKATDAINGLNIATSVAIGKGRIWVLNPPYLLAYPDADDDGRPDGPPVVHLDGFGMQDTHAVANSLTWGPDGWLYGAQGSTTTSTVNSAVTKNLFLQGQAIWRYDPASKILERFAEGGGNNPFNVEFDEKGRLYSGSNGIGRGPYYKQGGFYVKSWGKHGPLSNPYAFGYLPNMSFKGEQKRFTHALIKYEGGSLPARYKDKMISLNPYLNKVLLSRFEAEGSSFRNIDEEELLVTDDQWFRPVDIQAGPDGAVYMADWYDSRLTHIDPRDNWDKSSGRIYRLRNKDSSVSQVPFNLSKLSNDRLIALLSSPNEWFRRQSARVLGERKDSTVVSKLLPLLRSTDGQLALESLWAVHLSGCLNQNIALEALMHTDPFVRMWTVRLLGDQNRVTPLIAKRLAGLAINETHPEVLSQLASTARRLPAEDAIPIIKNLLNNHDNADDPDIPLLTWWAIEAKAVSDRNAVLAIFKDKSIWSNRIVRQVILKNLMQRYVMEGGKENFDAAAQLLKLAPALQMSGLLISGLKEGLHGKDIAELSPGLANELKPFQSAFEKAPLALAMRQGQRGAINDALKLMADNKAEMSHRLAYIGIAGEMDIPGAVPVLLKIVETNTGTISQSASELRRVSIEALQRYSLPEIGIRVVKAYPMFRADYFDRLAALELLATRVSWTRELLKEITESKNISRDDVPAYIAGSMKLPGDAAINKTIDALWPELRPMTTNEKTERMRFASQSLKSGNGDQSRGHVLFSGSCGACHYLFGEGGNIGPDLGAYNRGDLNTLLINIVDPGADIREGYEVQKILTTDGRTLEGRITSRNGGSITFRPPLGGKETTLAASQVKEISSRPASVMPERLLNKMTAQDIRDLFSYIMKKDK